jgi:citrate synthase
MPSPSDTAVRKGLAGVIADTTAISMVNPESNSLLYRGYPVQELARSVSFEEVAYLLWHGELPTADQLAAQNAAERAQRVVDPVLAAILRGLPLTAHPMDVLRTAVSMLGASDPGASDNSPAAFAAKALRLFAVLPAVVALDQRRRRGLEAMPPRADLGFAANFLYMTFGELPEPAIVTAFETSLTLYAEHSFNASAFTARVVASTLSDIYSAVTAAIGALKGPLHGGANEAVMDMMREIGTPDRAEPWLEAALADKRKIMGFGHRVYKNGDSRVPTMRAALGEIAARRDGQRLVDIYEVMAKAMLRLKGLQPNVDYPAGPAYHLIGFDTVMFTPIFVVARVTGWTAHIAEQLAANSLIRPLAAYTGPAERHLGTLSKRLRFAEGLERITVTRVPIGERVRQAHLDHFCPGGAGLPVTGSGPIGLGPVDRSPAGSAGNTARAAGQRCGRCEQQITAGQDARRRLGGTWVHEACPG